MSMPDLIRAVRELGIPAGRGLVVVCTAPGTCVRLHNPSTRLVWDSEGYLVGVYLCGWDEEGQVRAFRRSLSWSEGRLEYVSSWVEVDVGAC